VTLGSLIASKTDLSYETAITALPNPEAAELIVCIAEAVGFGLK
jgi:hypothetical protein